MKREIPLYTLEGVHDAEISTHYFSTGDMLGLSMFRFLRAPSEDVVLLIHGLTSSTDMFIQPEHYNLVSYLLDHGYTDVWTLDYRMSNRHPYNIAQHGFTLDDIALYDYPAALAAMRSVVGNKRIHVISQCLGALSFMMSLFGKAVDGVTSVVTNSVALTPRVPFWSRVKGAILPPLVEQVLGFQYVSPSWSDDRGFSRGKAVSKAVSLVHRECDVPACHMLSLMWGSGFPALYLHKNLHPITHRRVRDLFGPTNSRYHQHILKMVRSGNRAVKFDPANPAHRALPDDYLRYAAEIQTPVLLVTGDKNRVFADSNIVCHRELERRAPGRHQLHIFRDYGHQDIFMGRNAAVDVFPRFLEFLDQRRAASPRVLTARATA
jgi:lysosomal acid lipase/cholesteryl ester hydrolase